MPDIILLPSAAGTNTNLDVQPAALANYAAVGNFPENKIDDKFVFNNIGFNSDSYNLTTLASSPNLKINYISVELIAYAASIVYLPTVKGLIYIAGVFYYKPDNSLTNDDNTLHSFLWALNPADNERWELSDLATLEAGLQLISNAPATMLAGKSALDTTHFLIFVVWNNTNISISKYSPSGTFDFLTAITNETIIDVAIATFDSKFFIVGIGSPGSILCYSYDADGITALLDTVVLGDSYAAIEVDPTRRIFFTVSSLTTGFRSYTYTALGIITTVSTFAVRDYTALAIDYTNLNILVISDGGELELYTYNNAGTVTAPFDDDIALPTPGIDCAIDIANTLVFVITATQLRSIKYNGGALADVDNIATDITAASGISVDTTLLRIFVSEETNSYIICYTYDAAGNLTWEYTEPLAQEPGFSSIDPNVTSLFFATGAPSGIRSAFYDNLNNFNYSSAAISPIAPKCVQLNVNVNFSYSGEVVSNFNDLSSDEIHIDQDYTIIAQAEYGKSLHGCTTPQILYKDPNGNTGTIAAIVVDQDKLMATVISDVNIVVGKWRFKLYCVLPGGKILEGIPFFTNVQSRWDL